MGHIKESFLSESEIDRKFYVLECYYGENQEPKLENNGIYKQYSTSGS